MTTRNIKLKYSLSRTLSRIHISDMIIPLKKLSETWIAWKVLHQAVINDTYTASQIPD